MSVDTSFQIESAKLDGSVLTVTFSNELNKNTKLDTSSFSIEYDSQKESSSYATPAGF